MKGISYFLLIIFIFAFSPAFAQEEMFMEKKERKKIWRKWRKNKQSYNPYLDRKKKQKPSARIAKGERKDVKKQNRQAKRQLRRSKKQTRKTAKFR